ncbi:hypothetical protein [Brucella pituitosa]
MAEIKTGGAAFPCEGGSESGLYADPGMTLRDYFAANALPQSVLDYDRVEQHPNDNHKKSLLPYATKGAGSRESIIARQAYRYADAMIAAREGGAK